MTTPSETKQLGYLVGEFGWNRDRAKLLLYIYGALLPLSLLACLLLVGIPLTVIVIWVVSRSVQRLRQRQPVLRLYEKGLIDNRTSQTRTIYYADIVRLYIAATATGFGQTFYAYTFRMKDGGTHKLGIEVANPKTVGHAVQEGMVSAHLPQYLATIQKGEVITFDHLQVNAQGIVLKRKQIDWLNFDRAELIAHKTGQKSRHVFLDLYERGDTSVSARYDRDRFPNLAVFISLAEALKGTRRVYQTN